MKKRYLIIIIFSLVNTVFPQKTITLEDAYQKARENYPLIKQKDYIEKSKEYSVSNVWKGYFPQITLNAQATYQSNVTSLPISLPGMNIETLSKDQYKVFADVTQTLYDGGIMSSQSGVQESLSEIENQKLEIELIKVKERINQIYFGILLIDEQLDQIELIKKDLMANISKLEAAYLNGTSTKADVDILKAELLKTQQKEIEYLSSRSSFINMLSLLINEKLDESSVFLKPDSFTSLTNEEINRPELRLFTAQKNLFEDQAGLTTSKIIPKANLFFQGGYGKPALNMLKNQFEWYYLTGIRFSWPISNIYSYGNESEINELNKLSVDAQTETFLLNTSIAVDQQLEEIKKLKKMILIDKDIIALRTSVKQSVQAKLENGVVTSNDYIRELNAEDSAKQNLAMHEIQLLLAQYNYKITTGN